MLFVFELDLMRNLDETKEERRIMKRVKARLIVIVIVLAAIIVILDPAVIVIMKMIKKSLKVDLVQAVVVEVDIVQIPKKRKKQQLKQIHNQNHHNIQ